jgi:hypothetical protein
MVHLILGINFGFWALQQIFSTKQMLCIYIEGSMNIFIIYIGIIRPQSRFDYTNFKVSLVIKIINFNEKKGPSNYVCHLLCGCDLLSKFQFTTHLLHFCSK